MSITCIATGFIQHNSNKNKNSLTCKKYKINICKKKGEIASLQYHHCFLHAEKIIHSYFFVSVHSQKEIYTPHPHV